MTLIRLGTHSLTAWTHSHPDVSIIYRAALGHWLAGVVRYAIAGGEPVNLDYVLARTAIPELDKTGDTSHLLETARDGFRECMHQPPFGEELRAIQLVFGAGQPQARCNRGIRGKIWARLAPIPAVPSQLSVQLGFSLLEDEHRDASHITVVNGTFAGQPSALVLSDVLPSMIRNSPITVIEGAVRRGLPGRARARWRGLVAGARRAKQVREIRSLLWQAHQQHRAALGDTKGAMLRGIATNILEALEKSSLEGLPSRRTEGVEVVAMADPTEGLPNHLIPHSAGTPDTAEVNELLAALDPRAGEVLRLRYLEDLTQDQVAKQLGLSQPRVSQIERQAHESLLRALGRPPS